MTYNYISGEKKAEKIRIAKKVSQDFFGVEFDLEHLRKRDFDAIWNIAQSIFYLTYNKDKVETQEE
jgi:hypothetical protein